ncbi:hypothetical protein ACH5RR_025348 [Cinchona calisaya]|uniref:Uncharacterized protein n=1 Tax=Cinchona calisaya TaxID=153742 RepID=A0ABD2YZE2_9GENT
MAAKLEEVMRQFTLLEIEFGRVEINKRDVLQVMAGYRNIILGKTNWGLKRNKVQKNIRGKNPITQNKDASPGNEGSYSIVNPREEAIVLRKDSDNLSSGENSSKTNMTKDVSQVIQEVTMLESEKTESTSLNRKVVKKKGSG